jgi:hypothetical protein
MIILKSPITLILKQNYNKNMKKGTIVFINKIKFLDCCSSHIMLRVIDPVKKPIWLDSSWFKEYKFNKDEVQCLE